MINSTPCSGLRAAWVLAACSLSSAALAVTALETEDQWPQWRGPQGTGVAPQATPPVEWSETRNVQWKFAIPGYGTSTPIVWGDSVFILSAVPSSSRTPPAAAAPQADEPPRRGGRGASEAPSQSQKFVVMAVDRHTGKLQWERPVREEVPHEGHHRDHGFASASPITDGERLFAYFGSRGLYALDLEGKVLWEAQLGKMRTRNSFGEGASPALHGDTLVVNWDHEDEDFIVALDATTGKERWRRQRDEPTTWATPLIVEHAGKAQVVVNGTQRIRSYDLATGETVWECGGMTVNAIPTPVPGEGRVYVTSGFRGASLLAITLGRTGDLTDTDAIAWSHSRYTPYVPSPLLFNDRLWFLSVNTGRLSILDAKDGKVLVEAEPVPGLPGVYASPVAADGRIYLVGREGSTVVLKDGPVMEVLATNRLDDRFDASAAAVGSQLFLRGHQNLYCLSNP
jgi:outer membrane protein assembly factor BamB